MMNEQDLGNNTENKEEFYKKFKQRLEESGTLPGNYTYKFIIKKDEKLLAQMQQVFDRENAQIQMKDSKKGNYTSVSVTLFLLDADSVISFYEKISSIDSRIMMF